MKIIRPGNTETFLTFLYYVELFHKHQLNIEQKNFINNTRLHYTIFIYSTAGYYDKNLPINRTERDMYTHHDYTPKLKKYISLLLDSMKNSCILYTSFIPFIEKTILHEFIPSFINYLNPTYHDINVPIKLSTIKNLLINKKILVITPFKELIEKQLEYNFSKLYNKQHDDLLFSCYFFPYKFFNNGPHHDNNDTLNMIFQDIDNIDFDICLVSCGCDSLIIADHNKKKDKKTIYLGGHITTWFGIIGNRYKDNYESYITENPPKECLIFDIPEIYKPANYKLIENGCYW